MVIAALTLGLFEVLQPATSGTAEARPVADVLVTLIEAQRLGAPTRVTITLEGGAQLSGVVADLSGARGGGIVLLDGESVVHVIDPASVIAVSAPTREALANASPTPSKIDLQRRAEELGRASGEALGGTPLKFEIGWRGAGAAGLPESGERLSVVASALEEAAEGIRAAAADPLTRKDLARRLKRVRFAETPRAGASLSGDTLSIGIAPALGAAGRASSFEVRRALAVP